MKRLWLLVLASPLFLAGCLQFPGGDALTQTVQKGPPPPVDPKLAPAAKTAQDPAPAIPSKSASNAKSSFAPKQHTTMKRPVVTPEQVTNDTAYAMAEALGDEITLDMNTCATHGAVGCPHCAEASPK